MIAASTVCKMHAAGTDFFRSSGIVVVLDG